MKTLFANILQKKTQKTPKQQQQHVITFDLWKHYLLIFYNKKKKQQQHVITFDR